MRVLVLGAGGPAGVNFIRALRASSSDYWISAWDENSHHLEWPDADNRYLSPPPGPELLTRLAGYCDVHAIELVYAQPDALVRWLGAHRDRISAATMLPDQRAVEVCQDKLACLRTWERVGLRSGAVELDGAMSFGVAAERFGYPYWLRAAEGAGARGATLVGNPETARSWVAYWRARGMGWRFIAEEYLPGRNLAWMSVWQDGRLVSSTARERLAYIYPGASPSGITGTSSVSRSIADTAVNDAAARAVLAADPRPHGVYCVDLKEDAHDVPRPTEINAGRFFTVCDFAASIGANLPDLYVRLALGRQAPELPKHDAAEPGWLWLRHIDCPAVLVAERRLREATAA